MIHESARNLEPQDPNIAWATHRVADRVEGLAEYLRNSDLQDLRTDAEALALRHPVAFFGGLFIGGLVVGNLLKARTSSDMSDTEESDWDAGNASGSEEIPSSGEMGL